MSEESMINLSVELDEVIQRIDSLSLTVDTLNVTSAPNPPSFLVLEQIVNTHWNLRRNRRGRNMAFRVAGGCGGRRGRTVANA